MEDKISIEEKETFIEVDIKLGDMKIGEAEINPKTKELCRFYIFEPCQNKGYGKEALKKIMETYEITNLCVRTKNERAWHVYQNAGFSYSEPFMSVMTHEHNSD